MDTFARDHLPPREAWPDLALLDYPERLNAAVELLAAEGVAIAGGTTYAQLRARAEAIAASLQIEPGTRVLLHGPNRGDTIAAWLGILWAGGIVVATMPLLRAGEIAKVVGEGAHHERDRRARPGGRGARPRRADPRGPAGARLVRSGRHGGGRRGDHRLHQRHDRRAEGLRALPPGSAGVVRHVRARGSATRHDRRVQRHAAAGVHVRARGGGAVPAALRRLDGADGARQPARHAARARGDNALHRADRLSLTAARGAPRFAAHLRVGGRAVAGGGLGRVVREDRHPDRGRDRLDRDAAHLHRLAGVGGARGLVRAAGAGL